MAASRQALNVRPSRFPSTSIPQYDPTLMIVRCSATSSTAKSYNITLLPGDGIGPEIISVAKNKFLRSGKSMFHHLLFRITALAPPETG
ncbi:hypothetical protein L1887_09034 [Cichorium endivia]|nr:hypothetical protein L1887_09034 [Cichorium endivia]